MSIMDTLNEFANGQAITASAISNVIDLGADSTLRNIGGDDAPYLVVTTNAAAFATGTSLAVSLESDSTADLATSATVHFSTGAILTAALTANKTLAVVKLPYGDYERYLGVRFTVAGSNMTAGSINAFLTRDPQFYRALTANNPASHN